jgi:hypothetical protein
MVGERILNDVVTTPSTKTKERRENCSLQNEVQLGERIKNRKETEQSQKNVVNHTSIDGNRLARPVVDGARFSLRLAPVLAHGPGEPQADLPRRRHVAGPKNR